MLLCHVQRFGALLVVYLWTNAWFQIRGDADPPFAHADSPLVKKMTYILFIPQRPLGEARMTVTGLHSFLLFVVVAEWPRRGWLSFRVLKLNQYIRWGEARPTMGTFMHKCANIHNPLMGRQTTDPHIPRAKRTPDGALSVALLKARLARIIPAHHRERERETLGGAWQRQWAKSPQWRIELYCLWFSPFHRLQKGHDNQGEWDWRAFHYTCCGRYWHPVLHRLVVNPSFTLCHPRWCHCQNITSLCSLF